MRRAVITVALVAGALVVAAAPGTAGAATTKVELSVAVGPPTTALTVTGSGFKRSETVDVRFDGAALAAVDADGAGTVSARVTIPTEAKPGSRTVIVAGRSSHRTASAAFLVRTDWSQFGFSPAHQRFNPTENVLTADSVGGLHPRWTTRIQDGGIGRPPIVAGGRLIFQSTSAVYGIDAATGARRWTRPILSPAVTA
jgi:hypothetical protein